MKTKLVEPIDFGDEIRFFGSDKLLNYYDIISIVFKNKLYDIPRICIYKINDYTYAIKKYNLNENLLCNFSRNIKTGYKELDSKMQELGIILIENLTFDDRLSPVYKTNYDNTITIKNRSNISGICSLPENCEMLIIYDRKRDQLLYIPTKKYNKYIQLNKTLKEYDDPEFLRCLIDPNLESEILTRKKEGGSEMSVFMNEMSNYDVNDDLVDYVNSMLKANDINITKCVTYFNNCPCFLTDVGTTISVKFRNSPTGPHSVRSNTEMLIIFSSDDVYIIPISQIESKTVTKNTTRFYINKDMADRFKMTLSSNPKNTEYEEVNYNEVTQSNNKELALDLLVDNENFELKIQMDNRNDLIINNNEMYMKKKLTGEEVKTIIKK